jgi:predicted nucleic acid-binding protein
MTRRNRRNTVVLDTGPIYGLLDPKDQWHTQAGRLFEQLERKRADVIAAYPALLETHRLLLARERVPIPRIHALIEEAFEAFGVMYPVEADANQARASLRRFSDQRISLTDATVAAMAVREGTQVATFDVRHFGLMGAEVYPLLDGEP